MTMYQGTVASYDLALETPNVPTNYQDVIHLKGNFGLAFLYFVPEGKSLGQNHKRTGENVFDIFYRSTSWDGFVDMLRHESPVYFFYDDSNNTAVVKTGDEPAGEAET